MNVNDHIDATTREWITIDENGNFVFLDSDTQRQMETAARFEGWLAGRDDLHADSRRLLLSIGAYLKANAGSLQVFTVDHFLAPPFSNSGGLQRAVQVFGGMEQLSCILADLNRVVFEDNHVHEEHEGARRIR